MAKPDNAILTKNVTQLKLSFTANGVTDADFRVIFMPSILFYNTNTQNIIESLLSSFTLCLYKHYLLQDVIVGNFNVVMENANLPAINVTATMIVVITVTSKIVVCIS